MLFRSKRGLFICTAGILALTAVAGCGKDNPSAGQPTASSKTEPTASQAGKLPPVTIDWLGWQSVAQPNMESDVVKAVEERFNAKFNIWYVDDQKWDEVLNIRLSAGEVPDIMRLKNRANLKKYVEQGIVGEIPVEKIAKYAPNYMKLIQENNLDSTIWRLTNQNGKNYGFTGVGTGQYPSVISWRIDWLNKVGITKIPETLQEFEEAFYKFRNDDPDGNGKKDTYGLSNSIMPAVMGAFGAPPFASNDFKGTPMPELRWSLNDQGLPALNAVQPEMKEALSLLQKWYKDGIVDPEFVTGENKGGYWALSQDFMNGRVGVNGFASYYHWVPPLAANDPGGTIYQEWKKIKPDVEFGKNYMLGKAPVGPKGKSGQLAGENFTESMVFSSKVVKDERKVETILKMLDTYISDKDYTMMAMYGQKDRDYTINPDGTLVDLVKTVQEGASKGRNIFNFMQTVPAVSKKLKGPQYDFGDKYLVKAYTQLSIPATDAYSKSYASLQKLTVETYFKIITGEKSVDSFDEYVKTFMSNGGEEMIKQTQDAWKALTAK